MYGMVLYHLCLISGTIRLYELKVKEPDTVKYISTSTTRTKPALSANTDSSAASSQRVVCVGNVNYCVADGGCRAAPPHNWEL